MPVWYLHEGRSSTTATTAWSSLGRVGRPLGEHSVWLALELANIHKNQPAALHSEGRCCFSTPAHGAMMG